MGSMQFILRISSKNNNLINVLAELIIRVDTHDMIFAGCSSLTLVFDAHCHQKKSGVIHRFV